MEVKVIHSTESSPEFLQGMVSRMDVSYHRYGPLKDAFPHKVDAIASMYLRLKEYEETGNREFLIDAANFLMIEFMRPRKKDTYFTPTDRDASPGRIFNNRRTTQDNEGKRT